MHRSILSTNIYPLSNPRDPDIGTQLNFPEGRSFAYNPIWASVIDRLPGCGLTGYLLESTGWLLWTTLLPRT